MLTRHLYSFLGAHAFLIGIFPFYIPVYLYTRGFSPTYICCFIAVTGAGFCCNLYVWDRISKICSLRFLIAFSLISEFVLLSLFFLEKDAVFLVLSGFVNGVFNCNFWIIQRLLFLETVNPQNSGKKFGNFQIFIMVALKLGIFIGGVLLEKSGYLALYILSGFIVLTAVIYFLVRNMGLELNAEILETEPLSLQMVAGYRDRLHSRSIFAVDGVFLYLESYFWVISLFLIVQQSFFKLGVLVIVLTLFFGIVFVLIKNSVDSLPIQRMYVIAVILYSISWIMRGFLSERLENVVILVMLAVITFCTSLFRLVFNKRFFDVAKNYGAHKYIFVKSYFSQFFLAVFFTLLSFLLLNPTDIVQQFSIIYMVAALLSAVYLFYGRAYDH